jgi:hypothetical protein
LVIFEVLTLISDESLFRNFLADIRHNRKRKSCLTIANHDLVILKQPKEKKRADSFLLISIFKKLFYLNGFLIPGTFFLFGVLGAIAFPDSLFH